MEILNFEIVLINQGAEAGKLTTVAYIVKALSCIEALQIAKSILNFRDEHVHRVKYISNHQSSWGKQLN